MRAGRNLSGVRIHRLQGGSMSARAGDLGLQLIILLRNACSAQRSYPACLYSWLGRHAADHPRSGSRWDGTGHRSGTPPRAASQARCTARQPPDVAETIGEHAWPLQRSFTFWGVASVRVLDDVSPEYCRRSRTLLPGPSRGGVGRPVARPADRADPGGASSGPI